MLGFRDYRNKFIEAGVEPVADPTEVVKNAKTDAIASQIDKAIDGWVAELKRTLMDPVTPYPQQRGIWDRFKNSISNLWHGRYNQGNPYFWQNKLGDDLGRAAESFTPNPMSLSEYKSLREIVDCIEEAIDEQAPTGTENLRIVRLIDTKAQELKDKLRSILAGQPVESPPAYSPPPNEAPTEAPASKGMPPVDAPKTDEEEDSVPTGKDADSIEMLKNWATSLLAKNEIDEPIFKKIMAGLSSKKHTVRLAAARELEALAKKSPTKPVDDGAGVPPTDTKHALRPDQPPTTGKKWSELDDAEQQAWNAYGGGLEDTAGKIDGCLNDHGIKKLPWILRIGDPRRQILADQEQGKLGRKDGRCSKKFSHWHRLFAAQGRFEDKDHPITSWPDLEQRVGKVKVLVEKAKEMAKSKRTTAPSEEDLARDAIESKPKSAPLDPKAPDTLPVDATAPPSVAPELKDRKALIDPDEVKDKIVHTPDNALGKPAHRTTSIDAPEPPEGPTPEAKKSPREIKADLKARIAKIQDEETRQQLSRSLKIAKTEEALAEIEKELKAHEWVQDDTDLAWTIHDTKNFYKRRLHERKEPPKKNPDIVSFDERVNYYRELISQRN